MLMPKVKVRAILLTAVAALMLGSVLTSCSFGDPNADAQLVVDTFLFERNANNLDAAMGLFTDDATVGTANLQKLTGKAEIRQWLTDVSKQYFYKTQEKPVAQGNQVHWVEDLYSNSNVWVGELEGQATIDHSRISHMDANLKRGATGVFCPLCPPMCPGSDTPNLPCH